MKVIGRLPGDRALGQVLSRPGDRFGRSTVRKNDVEDHASEYVTSTDVLPCCPLDDGHNSGTHGRASSNLRVNRK